MFYTGKKKWSLKLKTSQNLSLKKSIGKDQFLRVKTWSFFFFFYPPWQVFTSKERLSIQSFTGNLSFFATEASYSGQEFDQFEVDLGFIDVPLNGLILPDLKRLQQVGWCRSPRQVFKELAMGQMGSHKISGKQEGAGGELSVRSQNRPCPHVFVEAVGKLGWLGHQKGLEKGILQCRNQVQL